MTPKTVKINVIISNFPIVAIITLGIYPLIALIMLLVHNNEYKNSSYAMTTGVLGLVLSIFGILPFIMGFFLEPKESNELENKTSSKMEILNKEISEAKKLLDDGILTQEEYDKKIIDLKTEYL